MHPLVFLAVLIAALGVASYGVVLTPLEPGPKRAAHFGLVIIFLCVLARFYGLM